jgi:hypothetical protein
MFRFLRTLLPVLAITGAVTSASAFALLGPYATWETPALSYNIGGVDVGGPMNLGEGYRWNIKTITYGFSKSFQDYFGQRGITEVNKAIAILNNLPPVSRMSASLSEFPLDTRQANYQAGALGLFDLKSVALGHLIEEFGLADPERYVWTLRNRFVTPAPVTNYVVIMRNFDPVTWAPTPYVNGILYTYSIIEYGPPLPYTDASESTVDPLALGWNSIAGIAGSGNPAPSSYFTTGLFFTGLTRDDVGGIRYLLRRSNLNVESLLPNTTGAQAPSAWSPLGAGSGGTNTFVNTALRPGVDKVLFRQLPYYGIFLGFTNTWTDTYVNPTNGLLSTQRVQRILPAGSQPDIVFDAGDLGVDGTTGEPFLTRLTDTSGWANNSATNNPTFATAEVDGPGVIQPPIVIAFTTIGPTLLNTFPTSMDQASASILFGGWAAIDGTTNAPFIFPNGRTTLQLEQQILSAAGAF